jgi:membrane protease YdiL (CAAX protease family)
VAVLDETRSILLAWLLLATLFAIPVAGLWFFVPRSRRLPPQRMRLAPWTGPEVVAAFLALIAWSLWWHVVIERLRSVLHFPETTHTELWEQAWTLPTEVVTVFVLFRLASKTQFYQLGLTFSRAPATFVAGYGVWLIFTPLVYLLNLVVLLVYQRTVQVPPEEHPLAKMLQSQPTAVEWLLAFSVGVLAAPVTEELLFRGVLQAWLVRNPLGAAATLAAAGGWAYLSGGKHSPWPAVFVLVMIPGYFVSVVVGRRWLRHPTSAPAIYASSLLFAAFHSTIWPTPIPLFVLSLALGYLVFRTQSLLSSITVHALFNGVAFVAVLLTHGATAPEPENGKATTSAVRLPPPASVSNVVPSSWLPRRT